MFLKELIFVVVFASSLHASPVKIKCTFSEERIQGSALYTCDVSNKDAFLNVSEVTSIDGNLVKGKAHKNVQAFKIDNALLLTQIPTGINSFFAQLTSLIVRGSPKLKKVHNNELKSLSHLTYLDLSRNAIESIEMDLFAYNSKLEMIIMQDNQITHVDPFAFSKLQKLRQLDLSANNCTGLTVSSNRAQVTQMIAKIEDFQCTVSDIRLHRSLFKHVTGLLAQEQKTVQGLEKQSKTMIILFVVTICIVIIGFAVVIVMMLKGRSSVTTPNNE